MTATYHPLAILFRIAAEWPCDGHRGPSLASSPSCRAATARSLRTWTYRRFPPPMTSLTGGVLAMEFCRIDVDISEQQKQDGEWVPLLSLERPNAPSSRKNDDPPVMSPTRLEAFDRHMRATAHAGNLLQGRSATIKSVVGFEGAKRLLRCGCDLSDRSARRDILFPAGLEGELKPILHRGAWIPMRTTARSIFRVALAALGFTISAFHFARWHLDSTPHRATKTQAEP